MTDQPDALVARALRARHTPDLAAWQAASEDLEHAIRLDPQDARLHAALAEVLLALWDSGDVAAGAAARSLFDRADAAAQQALALDETLAAAHVVRGSYAQNYLWDGPAAGRSFRRALALAPTSALAHAHHALYLATLGQAEASLAAAREALRLEPDRPEWLQMLGRVAYLARDYDLAIESQQRSLALAPRLTVALFHLGLARMERGPADAAIAALEERVRASNRRTGAVATLGQAYALAGREAAARQMEAELTARLAGGDAVPAYRMAALYARLGETEEAVTWLTREFARPTRWGPWLGVDPGFDRLRADPRFTTVLYRIGWAGHTDMG